MSDDHQKIKSEIMFSKYVSLSPPTKESFKIYRSLAKAYKESNNFEIAEINLKLAIYHAQYIANSDLELTAYFELASLYLCFWLKLEDALNCCNLALKLARTNLETSQALNLKGIIYSAQGRYNEATKIQTEAYDYAENPPIFSFRSPYFSH